MPLLNGICTWSAYTQYPDAESLNYRSTGPDDGENGPGIFDMLLN